MSANSIPSMPVLVRRPPARLSAAGLRGMLDLGMRVGEIAEVKGYALSTVTRHLNIHGIAPGSRCGPRSQLPPVAEIIARLEAGERPTAIARASGATPAAVSHTLYKVGLRLDCSRIFASMSATIIPANRLKYLRARKGVVTYSLRHCLTCSRHFRTKKSDQCVCALCRQMARHRAWEFRK